MDANESAGRVGIAIVGLGSFAHSLAGACAESERFNLISCFTRTTEKAKAFAEKFGCRAAASFEAILDDPNVEAAILVTPNNVHCEQTVALAKAGKHVFVEKPICNSLEEADRMIAACARADVLLAVGHQERRHSPYRYMKRCLEEGILGRIHTVEANHCGNLLAIWPEEDWRFSTAQGIGPLLHKGVHKIDILNYLFGEPEAVATMSTPLPFNPDMEQTTVSALRYASGTLGTFSSGFAHNSASFSIFGEIKSIFHTGYGTGVQVKTERTWNVETVECGPDRPLVEELAEFAKAIRRQATIEVDGRVARQVLAVALMLQKAAKEARVVERREFETLSAPPIRNG